MLLRSTVLGFSVLVASAAQAGSINLPGNLPLGSNVLEKMANAYSQLQLSPSIQLKLKSSKLNTIALHQRIDSTELSTTKFKHYYSGLEVIGSMAFHHVSQGGTEIVDRLAQFDLDTKPQLSAQDAIGVAQSLVGARDITAVPVLKILPQGEGQAKLVYWIHLSSDGNFAGRTLIIDAHQGEVIGNISDEEHASQSQIQVYTTAGGTQNLGGGGGLGGLIGPVGANAGSRSCQVVDSDGTPYSINISGCAQVVTNGSVSARADDSAKRAAQNASAVVNYYKSVHGRDSYDGRGSDVISVVHIGTQFANAFWNRQDNYMAYGDGDGVETGDFTRALDVAGHEMTHGVVSSTADLLSMQEAGALNEAYADFFGLVISGSKDWAIGRGITVDPSVGKPFRDLANPSSIVALEVPLSNGQTRTIRYPDKISQQLKTSHSCDDSNDNCFVHINATIPGHASYLVFQALGKAKAEKLYYTVLTQRLSSTATFAEAAAETRSTCKVLFDAATCAKVDTAFTTVGL